MISSLRGRVLYSGPEEIVVETGGIGWQVHFARPEKVLLGDEVTVYTYLAVREDDLSLYGFLTREERDLFLKLISVKGLGPKTGMVVLARTTPEDIATAIEAGDAAFFKRIPGIGSKTASQIILDLKGKLVSLSGNSPLSAALDEAGEALKALGYRPGEITPVLRALQDREGLSSNEYVHLALQSLGRRKGRPA